MKKGKSSFGLILLIIIAIAVFGGNGKRTTNNSTASRSLTALIMSLILVVFVVASACAADSISIEKIIVEADSIIVSVGKTAGIKTKIEPGNATSKKLKWASSDESIVTVKNGTIKGVSCGEAIVTATADDANGISVNIRVTVVQPIKKILLSDKKINMAPGTYKQIKWTIEPDTSSIQMLSWSSSNETVATVDNEGKITGISRGTANITATAMDGSNAKASITVKVDDYDLIFTSTRPQTYKYWYTGGGTIKIRGTVKNGNVSIPDISVDMWTSKTGGKTNESIEVTPLQPGIDVVTIKVNKAKLDVSVYVADYFNEYDIQPVPLPDTTPNAENGVFRDLIYGTPYSEVKEQLIEQYGNEFDNWESNTGFTIQFKEPNISVAGHDIVSLQFSFCNDQDKDGYITKDYDYTSFYQAKYIISLQKDDSIAEDLYSKLCGLYGKASSEYGTSRDYFWNDNDVSIHLNNYSDLNILYTWNPGQKKRTILDTTDKYLAELEEQRQKEQMKEKDQNSFDSTTDGL